MADPISPFTPTMQQQIEQLLQSQVDRSNSSTPIHQAAMAMASRMAPGYAQGAMTGPSPIARSGGGITPQSSGSSGPGVGTTAMAALAAALLKAASGSGGGGDLGKLLAKIKEMFQRGQPGVQGNQPFAGGSLPSGNPGMNGFTGFDGQMPNGLLPSDPGFYVGGGQPTDPSGGTNIGPGMQAYYDSLQNGGGGGDDASGFGLDPGPGWGG